MSLKNFKRIIWVIIRSITFIVIGIILGGGLNGLEKNPERIIIICFLIFVVYNFIKSKLTKKSKNI